MVCSRVPKALRSYNKDYLGNPSLNIAQNVNALLKTIEVRIDAPDALNSLSFAELLDKLKIWWIRRLYRPLFR